MNFAFTPEQEELRQTARAFLAEQASSEALRRAMSGPLGYDPGTWKQIGELGWTAVGIPETCGGLGLGAVERTALLEAMGEVLLASPFFATACLGAQAILAAGSEAQQRALLPGIAEGRTRATLAWRGEVAAERTGDGHRLRGEARFVLDGHCADLVVVAARGEAGLALFAVPGDALGLERRALAGMDQTRRLAHLALRDVRVPAAARLDEADDAAPALARALDLAAVALAAEQVGGAQRCLDLSVAHAKERVQFGRPIGSFQAIKHTCADMLVRVESARSAAYYAACAAAQGDAELPLVASLAKAWCSEAYFACAADALQVHGGVGFTWEYDVHLHLKRARSMERFLGDPAEHRERVAVFLGL